MEWWQQIRNKFINNRKVAENYFFMTLLMSVSLLITLAIYPYLIRVLGKEVYGSYVFVFSVIQFFQVLVSFGFDIPAMKKISLHKDDLLLKSRVLSEVIAAKLLIFVVCFLVLLSLIEVFDILRYNKMLFIILFFTQIAELMPPTWYFQGVQKMRVVSITNLSIRLLAIPFIIILVSDESHLLRYALITSMSIVVAAIVSLFYLLMVEKVRFQIVGIGRLKSVFIEAVPFFWTSAFETLRRSYITVIVGYGLGMQSVAVYDLANKLVLTPRMLVAAINGALFPNVIENHSWHRVKRIIRYEMLISLGISFLIIIFGYPMVILLGGRELAEAYPVSIILSFYILAFLMAECYTNFIFVPKGMYGVIGWNKLFATMFAVVGITISSVWIQSLWLSVAVFSISFFVEVFLCRWRMKSCHLE